MRSVSLYYPPSNGDISWYAEPDPIKTNLEVIRRWVYAGEEWPGYNRAIDPEHVDIRRGLYAKEGESKLYWHEILVARHYKEYTLIYANTDPAVNKVCRQVQGVLLNDAGFTAVPDANIAKLLSATNASLVSTSWAKSTARKEKDAKRKCKQREKATLAEKRREQELALNDGRSLEESIDLIFGEDS